jgi:hypothetical protein
MAGLGFFGGWDPLGANNLGEFYSIFSFVDLKDCLLKVLQI